MRIRAAFSFLAFAVIMAFSMAYFMSLGVQIQRPSQRINIAMQVPNINGLVVGSSVQLRGVPIGEITDISTTVSGATVEFYIDDRYKIPIDSDIRLENLSALGEAYIGLIPRSSNGPTLRNGQTIAAAAVTRPPSISELATTVVRVLNQLDPQALEHVINELDAALPDPATVLPNLSRTSTLLRNAAAHMNGKGRDLLDNFQALFRNTEFVGPVLAFNTPYIDKLGSDFHWVFSTVVDIYRHGGPQTVHNFSNFLGRLERLLDHSGGDLKVLMQTLLPYLNDISGALMNLDTAQVFKNMVDAVPEDGAVTLHLTIPDAAATDTPPGH